MARKIVWSKRASSKLSLITEYLISEWNEPVAIQFVRRTFHLVELLIKHPFIGQIQEPKHKIRGLVLTKHNKLFYRITPTKIIILNIFDTRSKPKK